MDRSLARSAEQASSTWPDSKLNGCGELKFTTFKFEPWRFIDGAASTVRVLTYMYNVNRGLI
jgi:hypothetical protein